ncbi:sialate O-acetylesterase [Chthoniobacter flavus]|uniref:sialate O-acetylesterase n=1 Tax=Chthoniobacter flavus TaxID=191863 RepID=UPI00104BD420|nr:sialate O-acetylesterase [Chthoniobacter flavus]TCO84397.1 sialate O-acetylesterase [Chthoniobacter flavus]
MNKSLGFAAIILGLVTSARAELKLPAIISDHMVLQQKQTNPIWGWDTPGTKVTVTFAGQTKSGEAGADGKWTVKLDPVPANATPQVISISGTNKKDIQDVLVGEVWMCSGQSNMGFTISRERNGDLETAAGKSNTLRLIKVPLIGSQELKTDFTGAWKYSDADSIPSFTAVGFMFGRYLHDILGIPVGLIDNAWGGSAAEAWVRRESLEKDPRFALLMENTRQHEALLQTEKAKTDYAAAMEKWKKDVETAKAAHKTPPRAPQSPEAWLTGNARPGNIFDGVVYPTLGYGMKGVIWYQGETNAGRAYEYAQLFPFMIEQWRKEWKEGDFPFYWVQLADYMAEKPEPGESAWAELRESQTKTMKLPNTGQAVIDDLGEGRDIHPRNKHDVAARLVRWALVKDYGMKIPYRSPEFKSVDFKDNKADLTFDTFDTNLYTFDVDEARGFAVCGEDKVWHWAKGKVTGHNTIEVSSDQVAKPIAVRYAWADNPVCNVYGDDGLPLTPFRTDDFPMITKPAQPAATTKK